MASGPYGPRIDYLRRVTSMESGAGRSRSTLAHRFLRDRAWCFSDLFWLPIAQSADAASVLIRKRPSPPRSRPATGLCQNGSEPDAKQLLAALMAFKRGDFSARLPDDWTGVTGKIADTFNDVITTTQRMTQELERIRRVVGKEGRITQRASLGDVSNSWADAIRSVNDLIGHLVQPTSEMARVIGAVAKGDLSNTMVDQLGAFASEVTRVAREVGTEGKLGGQAKVKGVAGTWKDLTENVNL